MGMLRLGRPAWSRGAYSKERGGLQDHRQRKRWLWLLCSRFLAECAGIEAEVEWNLWEEGGNEEAPVPQPRMRF